MSQPFHTTISSMPDAEFDLLYDDYRKCLSKLRHLTEEVRKLPEVDFFIFGMGLRQKLIYRDGKLSDAVTGRILYSWNVNHQQILPSEYCVKLWTHQVDIVKIWEDEKGIWLAEGGSTTLIDQGKVVSLPRFQGHPYASVLRVLHHEILVNIIDGKPVPNFWVYPTPWYRDSAVMALALRITGNDGLMKNWISSLREVYDRNNAGEEEADNLGEALFLISLTGDANHPLIPSIMGEISKWQQEDWICGRSDFTEHAVYQTKWLKFGLKSLGLKDYFRVPPIADSYSSLFWLDFQDAHIDCPRFRGLDYPYLNWAEGHFYKQYLGPMSSRDYPLSWEANASQANYAGLAPVLPEYIPEKLAAPHTWHAAEMFLSLWGAET